MPPLLLLLLPALCHREVLSDQLSLSEFRPGFSERLAALTAVRLSKCRVRTLSDSLAAFQADTHS